MTKDTQITRVELEFTPPDENAPGYLARMEEVYRQLEKVNAGLLTPAEVRKMADFLLQFVTAPADKEAARNVLLNHVSRKQYYEMLRAILRADGDAIVPFESGDN